MSWRLVDPEVAALQKQVEELRGLLKERGYDSDAAIDTGLRRRALAAQPAEPEQEER